ncbi:hypothetical protein TcasGA2_TC015437 [Tribolium castaneum]|uniref:Uncharacterized protein n=1 Tax=Tribolium castaneum TaxID=7070 RepID=D2A4Y3_TRICA|nr:hypothetical protein TcasGA2_TC015437 [Tribolium castaneum]
MITSGDDLPVNVELVKIRTIFELTGGRFSSEPAKIKSMNVIEIVRQTFAATQAYDESLPKVLPVLERLLLDLKSFKDLLLAKNVLTDSSEL